MTARWEVRDLAEAIVANDGRVGARGATLALAEAYLALVAERDRLREALIGVQERDRRAEHRIGPCWCPDWLADDWDLNTDPAEWVHHDACVRARAALSAVAPPPPPPPRANDYEGMERAWAGDATASEVETGRDD